MPLSGTLSQVARCSTCLRSYARFVSATEKGDGCGGKGGAVTLGLQMGFPQERHAPVFFETETGANMVADPSLHLREQLLLVFSSCVTTKGLLPGTERRRRLYPQGQGLDLWHKDFLRSVTF